MRTQIAPPLHASSSLSPATSAHVAVGINPRDFLADLSNVKGRVRFIVIGDGAILESVASMNKLNPVKYNDIPKKGTLATFRWGHDVWRHGSVVYVLPRLTP